MCVTLNSYHIVFRSLEDAAPGESFTEDGPITYEVLPGASQRGKDLLADSIGYTYNVKVLYIV